MNGMHTLYSDFTLIIQWRLNLLKVVGAHLTNKTNFYGKKLNSYEQLIKVVGHVFPMPPGSAAYALIVLVLVIKFQTM